ncbi:MAG TPA: PQQ-binding-like beta-propeller repeat protein [Verrucomicrobiae bacterium]
MPINRRTFLNRSAATGFSLSLPLFARKAFGGEAPMPAANSSTRQNPALNYWPQWRGPLATGVAPFADPPLEWSESKNIKWKLPLAGKGHSSPIIWGDYVYLMSAEPLGDPVAPVYDHAPGSHDNVPVTQRHQYVVIAVRRSDGAIAWKTKVHEDFPHEGGHQMGSLASNSPVTDGEFIYAFFGSHGLYCLDTRGEVKWRKDLGKMQTLHAHGEGSSPVIFENSIILNWDHEADSWIFAFDKKSGRELWKVSRDEKTSWSTPIIVAEPGLAPQVVVSASKRIRAYDPKTGSLIWECGGLSGNVVSSPVAGLGMVFAGNSYDGQNMVAIRLQGAKGDITGTDHVAWKLNRSTPYVPSPLLYGNTLYFLRHYQNVLSVLDAKSGKQRLDSVRLGNLRDIFASPIGAANRTYITSREGSTIVLRHGGKPDTLALNQLEDSFSASAALAGRDLYLRGERFLYSIANPSQKS